MAGSEQLIQRLERELDELEQKQRKRKLQPTLGVDFTSNDYLGLTNSLSLKQRIIATLAESDMPLGAGGSRLLRGNHRWHEEAEKDFAAYQNCESSLFFTSGYAANMAVFTALPTRHDVIIFDALVHASIREGIHASFAQKKSFAHNSLESLEAAVQNFPDAKNIYVVVESLYSMDGDESPLKKIASYCNAQGFLLVVDEAHATGLFGQYGRGLIDENGVREQVFLSVHPCGKGLASAGAFICCADVVKQYFVNRARTMIFTTALPPVIALQLSEVIREIQLHPELIERVHQNTAYVRSTLNAGLKKWTMLPGRSPIVPLIIGSDEDACAVALELQSKNIDVRPIRPPTVAEGTSRFRMTISAMHTQAQLEHLCESIFIAEKKYLA